MFGRKKKALHDFHTMLYSEPKILREPNGPALDSWLSFAYHR